MLIVNTFGSLAKVETAMRPMRPNVTIIDGIDGPDPSRYNLPKLSIGICAEVEDVNKWIGFSYLRND
jgi:hypothetical protein